MYLLPLAGAIPGDGSHVFEETRALDVRHGNPCVVETDRGVVRADDVVLATHLPFEDKGLFFAKTHPERSYALAGRVPAGAAPEGMFLGVDQPTRSLRTIPFGDGVLLLVGGEGHKTGEADTTRHYDRLEQWARSRFELGDVQFRWSTHDYVSVDRVIGDRTALPGAHALEALTPGEGVVVRIAGRKLAVSRREDGELVAVSPTCTHMGCLVAWNTAEHTWDCPCHGSRYLPHGAVIEGPAVRDLPPQNLPAK